MSADPTQALAFDTNCHLFDGCGFDTVAPGLHSFLFEPLMGDADGNAFYFNKPMLLALLGSIIVVGFFWAAFARPKVVPGKLQMIAEASTTTSYAAASSTRRSARRRARSTFRSPSPSSSSSG